MSLADIKTKINEEARSQIDAILSESEKQRSAIAKDADDQVRNLQNSYRERFAKEEPEILKRREIVAGLDAAKVDLGVRQQLIGEAFDGALRQLAELPKDKYLAFVQALMEKAVESGNEAVLVGKNEKHIDGAWVESYNAAHGTHLSLAEERLPLAGGFVLRKENIDTNCSWDMLVRDVRPELEADVVKRLFS